MHLRADVFLYLYIAMFIYFYISICRTLKCRTAFIFDVALALSVCLDDIDMMGQRCIRGPKFAAKPVRSRVWSQAQTKVSELCFAITTA